MIRHEAICVNTKVKHFEGFQQQSNENHKVCLIQKDTLAMPTMVHCMVPGSGVLYSTRSGSTEK